MKGIPWEFVFTVLLFKWFHMYTQAIYIVPG